MKQQSLIEVLGDIVPLGITVRNSEFDGICQKTAEWCVTLHFSEDIMEPTVSFYNLDLDTALKEALDWCMLHLHEYIEFKDTI